MLAGLPAGALALRFIERSHRTHLIFAPAAQSFCREVAMSGIVTMVALLLPGQAHAEEHFELAAGFFGGQRSLGQAPFAHVSGVSGAAVGGRPYEADLSANCSAGIWHEASADGGGKVSVSRRIVARGVVGIPPLPHRHRGDGIRPAVRSLRSGV